MAEIKIESSNISIFPSVRRIGRASDSRNMSEKAITRIINTLIDKTSGFIITPVEGIDIETILNNPFEFNIHGYYVKVATAQSIVDSFTDAIKIYANIVMDSTSEELIGFDDDNYHQEDETYSGVIFTSDEPSSSATYSLLLFERDSSSADWEVAESSKEKFDGTSFQVDGGLIS